MSSDNIVNFQGSTTILNVCTKKVWNLIEGTTYIYIYIYIRKNFSFLLIQREKKVDISKLIGPLRHLYSLRIFYFILTYVYVSRFMISSENISNLLGFLLRCGTKAYEWGTKTYTCELKSHWVPHEYGLVLH